MKYVVFGGTGTLGTETIRQLLDDYETELVTCVSRCELKQKNLLAHFRNKKLRCFLADIRDRQATLDAVPDGTDTVFHFAALKHVDTGEAFPAEFIKTNTIGSINVADAAAAAKAKFCILSSTDKAVEPINAYGMTKGLAEKIFFSMNNRRKPLYSVYRWGNVFGSRGSAIESFSLSLKSSRSVDITHKDMTRFWIRIEDAVKFMLSTYKKASLHSPMIPPIKAASLLTIIEKMSDKMGIKEPRLRTVGLRPGEKIHESLLSDCDGKSVRMSSDGCPQMTSKELDSLFVGLPI